MNAVSVFGLPVSETTIDRLGWVLVHSLWQFTLVALLAAVVMRVMRRSSADARCGVLIGLLVLSIVFPIVTWTLQSAEPAIATAHLEVRQETPSRNALPIVDRPIDTSIVHSAEETAEVSEAVKQVPALVFNATADTSPQSTWTERATAILRPWLAWTVGFWVLGVVLCSIRPLMGWLTLRRLKRVGVVPASKEVLASLTRVSTRLGLDRSMRVLESSIARVPLVVGYLRPVILLPVSLLTNIPATQLDAILAHELAHIRRHDFLVNLLQILIETLFFYHPAVWWLSHRIRVEREHCCDDLVVRVMENRTEYGRALIAIDELRGRGSVLALGASDGSLLARVCRIAGQPRERTGLPAGTAFFLLVCLVGAVLAVSFTGNSGVAAINDDTTSAKAEWGEAVNGLRMRVVLVHADMSEEDVGMDAEQRKFKTQEEVAFAIEMENVSDKPIRVLDTRYGNTYGDHSGKPNSNWFGQFLFSIEYFDADGKKVEYPHVEFVAPDLSGNSLISEIAPGGSHRFLIRPAKWRSVMYQRLKYRRYTAVVHYHGLDKRAADRLQERKPTSETLNAWSGDVASVATKFQIARPVITPTMLYWGEPDNGLQAAMSLSPFLPWYGHGQKLDILLHIQNVSDKPITLASEMWLSVASLTVEDAAGNPIKLGPTVTRGGFPTMIRTTLQPQQTIVLGAGNFGIAKTQEQADGLEDVTHSTIVAPTGEYRLQLSFESWRTPRMEDGKGRQLAPLDGDYVGNLTTGKKYLFLKDQPFDMSKEKVENASTPRQWAEIYVNQVRHRRNADGTYPASVFDTLRRRVLDPKSDEPGLEAWQAAIDAKQTWTQEELLAHVLDLAEYSFPIVNLAYHDELGGVPANKAKPGRTPTAGELEGLPFGQAAENGLRVAWVFEPERSARAGETVGGRMVFHNSGNEPVTFSVEPWGWTAWEARNQRGDKVKVRHVPLAFWIGTYVRYRLEPGQIAETIGEPLGFGELSKVDHTLATTWIPAQPGDLLSVAGQVKLGRAKSKDGISVEGDFTEPLQIKERTFEIRGVAGAEDGNETSSTEDARRTTPKPTRQEAMARIVELGGEVRSSGDTVEEVILFKTEATDADLAVVQRFDKLIVLILTATRVTDTGLAHISDLTSLGDIDLTKTRVTDDGLVHLKKLKKLEYLSLIGTNVTDEGLAHVQGLTNLVMLLLEDTNVTSEGLVHLKGLTNLKTLHLSGTKITDEGLEHVKKLTGLRDLRLSGTSITDAGLDHLRGLTDLRTLELYNTAVTDKAVNKVRVAVPGCKIYR